MKTLANGLCLQSVFAVTLAASMVVVPSALRAEKNDANTLGYRAYRKGDFEKALSLFEQATEETPNNALGHYNFACTLAIMRKQDKTCDHDAYMDRIIEALTRAIALDRRRQKRALKDKDLTPIHQTFYFQTLKGHDWKTDKGLAGILAAVQWRGRIMTARRLRFFADGRAQWQLDADGESVVDGRFEVKDGKVHLKTPACDGKKSRDCGLHHALDVKFSGIGAVISKGGEKLFRDLPDDCGD